MTDFNGSVHIVPTSDGSPTARLSADGELMHSSHGAWSETLFIYRPCVETVFQHSWPLSFLSVGLGMGYVEMMVVAEMLKHQQPMDSIRLLSFENSPLLMEQFEKWISTSDTTIFDHSLAWVSRHYDFAAIELKDTLVKLYREKKWILQGELVELPQEGKYSAIFYDAFSKKSGEQLWTEDFLSRFLNQYADNGCVLSTYAATSALKRALKSQQFVLQEKSGFIGKRESTFAIKIISL
mgnify:CR=1 FL=1